MADLRRRENITTLDQLPPDALESIFGYCGATSLARLAQASRRLGLFVATCCEQRWKTLFRKALAPHFIGSLPPKSWYTAFTGWLTYRPYALRTVHSAEQRCSYAGLEDSRQVFGVSLSCNQQCRAGGARVWACDGRGHLREISLDTDHPLVELRSLRCTDAAALSLAICLAVPHEILVGTGSGGLLCFDQRAPLGAGLHAWSIKAHTDDVFCVARDSNSPARIATTSADSCVHIWDARRVKEPVCSLEGPTGSIFSCTFAQGQKGGDWIFAAGEDKMVHKFDCCTGEWIAVLAGHKGDIYSVCVAGDLQKGNRVLLSAGLDGLLKLWAIESDAGEQVRIPGIITFNVETVQSKFVELCQDPIGQLNCGTCIEGLVANGESHCITAKRCGVVEQWSWEVRTLYSS